MLPFATVSTKHCLLELREGMWFVSDLASRNGIRIDGVKVQEGRLRPGCILSVAEYRFQVNYAVNSPLPAVNLPPRQGTSELNSKMNSVPRTLPRPPVEAGAAAPQEVVQHGAPLGELVPCGGGAPIPLRKARLIVGRSASCDIVLHYPVISSKHCQLDFLEGFWHVRDLGSRNGVRVDGHYQSASHLKPGAILSIAEYRYQIAYTPMDTGPPPDEDGSASVVLEAVAPGADGAAPPPISSIETKKRWVEDENQLPRFQARADPADGS